MDGICHVEDREDVPYKNGFDTKTKEFQFLEELDIQPTQGDTLFLITPKSSRSLNSQFKREESVYMHPSLGFNENEEVTISSTCGSVKLKVKNCNDVREDSVLIYSGTKGVNNLTNSKHSLEGKCAMFQEEKVKVRRG